MKSPSPSASPRVRAFGVCAAVGVAVLACAPEAPAPETIRKPVVRFVQPAGDAATPLTVEIPVGSIQNDNRFVLAEPVERLAVWSRALTSDERAGRATLRIPIQNVFRGSRELVVFPRLKLNGRLVDLPPQTVELPGGRGVRALEVEVPLPPVAPGDRAQILASVAAPQAVDLTDLRTREVAIPAGAQLEFAVGLLRPRWGDDPVAFSVAVCRADDCEVRFSEVFDPSGPEGPAWRDRRIELHDLAGQRRSLRFTARRLREEAPYSFPVWANPTLYAPAPRVGVEPNVILLSIDTLRADHLTTYGYRYDTAPFIDERFGRGGTVFDHPVASATTTAPSHASIFTSLNPEAHGTDGANAMPKTIPTLPETLRAAGIDTGAVTEDGWLGIDHGFGRGFDVFVENKSASVMLPEGHVESTFARAARWLEHNRDKRFFLFLHTFQVHSPYAPPKRYHELFGDTEGVSDDAPTPSHLRWRADYDREIRYTDDVLRRLFETLEGLDLAENTVFILTSDHGEAFLEHGRVEHGGPLYDEVVHVPLMFWGPGVPAGARIDVPVSHVDLMPTILELFGVAEPPSMAGRSLLPLLSGSAEESEFAARPVYSETRSRQQFGPERTSLPFYPPAVMVRQGDRKLTRYRRADGGFRYELFDLAADPGESTDLWETRSRDAGDLSDLLADYEERSRRIRALREGGSEAEPVAPDAVVLDPEREEKLRALGYLD